MKKILIAFLAITIVGCTEEVKQTKTSSLACENVKAVNDKKDGKVYYAPSHKMYQHVTVAPEFGDRNFCSVAEAKNAGFSEAPRYFANSTAKLVDCLKSESGEGSCHNYVVGIYQSLAIYERVCGSRDISSNLLVQAIYDHTGDNPSILEVDRFEGAASSFLEKYQCSSSIARKNS